MRIESDHLLEMTLKRGLAFLMDVETECRLIQTRITRYVRT